LPESQRLQAVADLLERSNDDVPPDRSTSPGSGTARPVPKFALSGSSLKAWAIYFDSFFSGGRSFCGRTDGSLHAIVSAPHEGPGAQRARLGPGVGRFVVVLVFVHAANLCLSVKLDPPPKSLPPPLERGPTMPSMPAPYPPSTEPWWMRRYWLRPKPLRVPSFPPSDSPPFDPSARANRVEPWWNKSHWEDRPGAFALLLLLLLVAIPWLLVKLIM
jgi:hypothetical protein